MEEMLDSDHEVRRFSMITNKILGTTVQPHPITRDDILDFDGKIPEQFEDTTDDPDQLMMILDI